MLAATENPKVIAQYLKVGGKPLELIQSLERVDKQQPFHIAYVFNALQMTLIEILSSATQLTQPAVQACSYLLNSHRACVEKLLHSTVGQQKRSVLKLLTAIVALEPQFGRDILATLNVVFNTENMEKFTRHNRHQSSDEDVSVRTCYIHFILAYLIEGNIMLIRNLLDRNELMMALVSGLVYDSHETVTLVLSTLQRFVLKTAQVSKTKKVQVFNVSVVKQFLQLYEWKGPAYFNAMFNKKTQDKADDYVNATELNAVQESVHEFLTVLLASRKFGIAFQCLGFRRTKSNATQKKILGDLERPWTNARKADLTIQILRACPELARSFIKIVSPSLEPKNKHGDWFAAVDYFCKLIDQLTPSILRVGADQMSAIEMSQVVKAMCMAPEILQHLRNKFTIRSENLRMRHKYTELLFLMFRQCNQHLFEIGRWAKYTDNDMRKIKFDLINHVFVMCPSVETILLSLHQTLQQFDEPEMLDHLEIVLDLLLIISSAIPSFIEQTASVINYIKILRPIYELNRDNASSTRIEMKAVRLILALEPKALSLKTEFFQQVIQSILNVFRFGVSDEQTESRRLLRNVFQNTGIFENGTLEVDQWLEAFRNVDEDSLTEVKDFFVEALTTYDLNNRERPTADDGMMAGKHVGELFHNMENGITLNGVVDVPMLGGFFGHFVAKHAALDKDVALSIQPFLEQVAIALFHYLPVPNGISSVLHANQHKYEQYMRSWLNKGKSTPLDGHPLEILSRASAALLNTTDLDFVKLVASTTSGVRFKLNGIEQEVDTALSNETQCMSLLFNTMFIVVKQSELDQFQEVQCNQAVAFVKGLLEVLHQLSASEAKNASSGFEVDQCEDDSFAKALRYIFCSRYYLLNNFTIWERHDDQLTRFVYEIIAFVQPLASPTVLSAILQHYRTKLTNQINWAIESGSPDLPITASDRFLSILSAFTLEYEHCAAIIVGLTKLASNRFITADNDRSIYADIMGFTLKRLANLKTKALEAETIQGIANIYIGLIRQVDVDINFERIEDALFNYLSTFYHNIGDVPADLFKAIFECRKLNKPTVKLASLLLERNNDLNSVFLEILPARVSRKELIYPLLNVACRKAITFEATILTAMYAEFKNGILKTIEKPQKAGVIYKENVYSSLFLIERCMPANECIDFCRKALKFDAAEVYQLQIIKAIHLKALHSDKPEVRQLVFVNFVNISVQLLGLLLKTEALEFDKINSFAAVLADWFKFQRRAMTGPTPLSFDKILKSQVWPAVSKACLKFGLQRDTTDPKNMKSAVLLKLLGFLCDRFYADDVTSDDCGRYFEMAISHSEFFGLALQQEPGEVKTNLMYLLFVLVKKCSMPLKPSHVPVFLGAYQAKLSRCDRFVLAILQKYEHSGIDMHPYKPFIWGDSAIAHYSIRGAEEATAVKTTLYQEPPMMQAMSLIDKNAAEETLAQFPVWRRLNAIEQVPSVEFRWFGIPGNEHLDMPSIASNRLEQLVDENQFDPDYLLLSARKEESLNEIYDPAFFIPLMSMAFAPEAFTRPVRPAQNGLLAMTFATLSSQDKNMRLAGANALMRYRSHLETAHFVDSRIWFHMFDCVQRGLGDLTTEMQKHKKARIPRVPYVAGCFLGRTVNALINPLNEMYRPLSNFLLFQKAYNFLSVPEFNVFFNSSDINHSTHRHFMLEVLRDGIKCGSDFTILMAASTFKAVLGFYNSPMATRETNLLILTVINASVKIPKSAKVMIETVGILPWLSTVIDNVDFFKFDIIDGICSIINNLWYSIRFNIQEYGTAGIKDIDQRLFNLLLKLCPQLSTRTSQSSFAKYLNVLAHVTTDNGHLISETNLDHLIKCARTHIKSSNSAICDIAFVKQSNESFCDSKYSYVRRLRAIGGPDESVIFIDATLRELIVDWLKLRKLLA